MSADNSKEANKRTLEQLEESDDCDIGPSLSDAIIQPHKKKKGNFHSNFI